MNTLTLGALALVIVALVVTSYLNAVTPTCSTATVAHVTSTICLSPAAADALRARIATAVAEGKIH